MFVCVYLPQTKYNIAKLSVENRAEQVRDEGVNS